MDKVEAGYINKFFALKKVFLNIKRPKKIVQIANKVFHVG